MDPTTAPREETQQKVDRLQTELSTLRKAVGLELPYGREEIRAYLVFGASGAIALVWALLPTGWPAQWGTIPLVLAVVTYGVWMRARYRRDSGRSPVRRIEYSSGLLAMVLVAALALVYRFWASKVGISAPIAGSAALFLFGLFLLVPVLRDRGRMPELGISIPLMVCGLLIPLVPVSPWVVLGATFMVGGLATAAITARCLKLAEGGHVAH